MDAQVNEARRRLLALEQMVCRRIKGCDRAVRTVIACLVQDLHVDLLGLPGSGKTLCMTTLRDCIRGAKANRIQFTPDLMPADITGTSVFNEQTRSFDLKPGPIFANIVLADEINRTPPRTQSALLEAMQEKQVTLTGVANETLPLPKPFFVIATQNHIEQEGTYPLPEAQEDRFGARVLFPRIKGAQLRAVIGGVAQVAVQEVIDITDILKIRKIIKATVTASDAAIDLIGDIVEATDPETNDAVARYLACGVSPRAGQSILGLARYMAFIAGRPFVNADDIKLVAPDCLRHRMTLLPQHLNNDPYEQIEKLIATLLSSCAMDFADVF